MQYRSTKRTHTFHLVVILNTTAPKAPNALNALAIMLIHFSINCPLRSWGRGTHQSSLCCPMADWQELCHSAAHHHKPPETWSWQCLRWGQMQKAPQYTAFATLERVVLCCLHLSCMTQHSWWISRTTLGQVSIRGGSLHQCPSPLYLSNAPRQGKHTG